MVGIHGEGTLSYTLYLGWPRFPRLPRVSKPRLAALGNLLLLEESCMRRIILTRSLMYEVLVPIPKSLQFCTYPGWYFYTCTSGSTGIAQNRPLEYCIWCWAWELFSSRLPNYFIYSQSACTFLV